MKNNWKASKKKILIKFEFIFLNGFSFKIDILILNEKVLVHSKKGNLSCNNLTHALFVVIGSYNSCCAILQNFTFIISTFFYSCRS